MVVKNQIKFIKSLQQKKYRNEHGLFVAEGIKLVQELLLSDLKPYGVYTTQEDLIVEDAKIIQLVSESDLKRMSGLQSPNKMLGVFYIPKAKESTTSDGWIVALDEVRDPGNLGTIIRLCDWFDIPNLVCANKTVDCYNPKVLQASMGSISRVNTVYTDLSQFLKQTQLPIYGAIMDGNSVYKEQLPKKGILLLGNEANGISDAIVPLVTKKISIPQYGAKTAESLNVAMATALLLGAIRNA